jgi:prolyl-tRNA synthetase
MMQDRKALQAGTSHFLGQNFSKAQQIKFQSQQGQEEFAWTTSWGVSTRLIGGLIMTHSDDDGLVLPPRLATKHVVLMPIYRSDEERATVLAYVAALKKDLEAQRYDDAPVRVLVDDRDDRGKSWYHVKRGVPLRVEIGPRDIADNALMVARRDTGAKEKTPRDAFVAGVPATLAAMQKNLFDRALAMREANTQTIDTLDDFRAYFTPKNEKDPEIHGGFALCHWHDDPAVDALLKELKVTIRCIPLDGADEPGKCVITGQPSSKRVVFAKAY